jgi:hypothetical protein
VVGRGSRRTQGLPRKDYGVNARRRPARLQDAPSRGLWCGHTPDTIEPRRPMMSFFLTIESHQNFGRIADIAASWATAPTTPPKIVAGICNRLRLRRTSRRTFRPRVIEALIRAAVLRGNAGFFGSLAPPKTALAHSQGESIDMSDNQLITIDYTLLPETLSLPPRKNASRYFSLSSKRGR